MSNSYVGRFAPSPSGPLHFGSLIAAVGSYLQAKASQGTWLVRMEDLDPPREVAGAAANILTTLEAFGLHWDREVIYQSQRSSAYKDAIAQLNQQDLTYYCHCTRKQIQAQGAFYQGQCKHKQLPADNASLRVTTTTPVNYFIDELHGRIAINQQLAAEDFIIHRKDGLFAYNLAVVVDDIYQGITQVVRGADLIEPTGRQLYLFEQFAKPAPSYLHLPLVSNADGSKLSKQNHAPGLDISQAKTELIAAFRFLALPVFTELQDLSIPALLQWGTEHWSVKNLPRQKSIVLNL
ncbi:tRNA glutamyl-Q(34) synthetase GluQRS [Moritella sp. Urea-trap-13]|uniref:tRNA glutamyl-Q(34) synthetase GluQRS n=1 Tax=Moritella sp. Urea-trap-13 TaxID=2058327 RepID=UPI000C32EB18|nr:tRNA glutamyl-Q(34) synthetase GluQRS [Moritella sp. Urea-trap-13]PKH09658.1 tRNA glutamyl-Q(34) synthetase GluQRS [Moritella sp. Urea-trap-13]